MTYQTPEKYFFRCAFPRGRLLSHVEDDLTILTQLITQFSGKPEEEFNRSIDEEYAEMRSGTIKTIRNYRTEMLTLFGLTVTSDGMVEASARNSILIESQSFPLFFRTFCGRFQFPNCINKPQETLKQVEAGVRFKPAKFILELFLAGNRRFGSEFSMDGNEISNLVFNDIRVTTGKMNSEEVLDFFAKLRRGKVRSAGGSKIAQHGREFMGYMMLGNLLRQDGSSFSLNHGEKAAIEYIVGDKNFFDVPSEYASDSAVRRKIEQEWMLWYGDVDRIEKEKLASAPAPVTSEKTEIAEGVETSALPGHEELRDIGDRGERIVLKYERDRIGGIRPDKLGLVKIVANDTELGYDIQSLEFADVNTKKFIEVKTTERTFPPSTEVLTYFPMSSNEWETARSQKDRYYIYRVFLTNKDPRIFVIQNPVSKEKTGHIILEPLKYRVVVKKQAGEYIK